MYQACPSQDCNKKVIDQQNGLYRCEKCDREFPNFKYRLMLLVSTRIRFQGVSYHVPSTIQTQNLLKELLNAAVCAACELRGYLAGLCAVPE